MLPGLGEVPLSELDVVLPESVELLESVALDATRVANRYPGSGTLPFLIAVLMSEAESLSIDALNQ